MLVCDDSSVVRLAITRILDSQSDMRVIGGMPDGQAALSAVASRRGTAEEVEVVVLDLEMPVMDGLTALPMLLRADPTLQILISSVTTYPAARSTLRALSLGAADYVTKPSAVAIPDGLQFARDLVAKIGGLARLRRRLTTQSSKASSGHEALSRTMRPMQLLVIGSSTGGPRALFSVLGALGTTAVPVIVAQHMPAIFTPLLAEHIDSLGGMPCSEVHDGEALLPGHVYVAPGGRDLRVAQGPAGLIASVIGHSDLPGVQGCHPSVDVLLHSAAMACPGRTLVMMLTGMGRDGFAGTQAVVAGGGLAMAQDEASSVVWGMPGAIARGGMATVVPLDGLAGAAQRALATRFGPVSVRALSPSHRAR